MYSDQKIGRGRKLYMHYCIYNMEDIWDWHLVLLLIYFHRDKGIEISTRLLDVPTVP